MKYLLSIVLSVVTISAFAQGDSTVISLWKNGAPGFESKKDIPEKGPVYASNINNPSVTVYLPPKEKATGAAVLICPGGGHRMLVMTSEGHDPAKFLNSIGVAAIVLKYRLGRDTLTPYYKIEVHGREDGNRAMRLIRSNAAAWGIDANRIGIWGFSAGGEITNMVAYDNTPSKPNATEPVDRLSSKPDFVIETYPGPLYVPEKVTKGAPPAFLVAANDDECCSLPLIKILNAYRAVGAHAELHIFAKGNHAFNMGKRSEFKSLKEWPLLLANWFADYKYFKQ
ncbi:alpha/beta hydrolase [Mucilaginibacter ginkgonis]|uniref:Alpha/beta hydrolase n=1 Tax=Mucilaginibacter ginkgonis TaxID=2682091 RepID=A0A6I4HWD1_9SPHI|nr:alpha/beta hydrolase [Mucilaginibacter ginkgonis]QQL51013.1 alpha/beta hydrolase [Mucilaginibacter ginkgonis]